MWRKSVREISSGLSAFNRHGTETSSTDCTSTLLGSGRRSLAASPGLSALACRD